MIESMFRVVCYVAFGVILEWFFVILSKVIDGKIRGNDIYLEGHTYLWMAPVYGVLLLFIFEPVFGLISGWNIIFRYIVWAISFTFFEGFAGFMYEKLIGFCPWDYSQSKWKIFKNGYTKYSLIPLWGLAGLLIEMYSKLIIYLSPMVSQYIVNNAFLFIIVSFIAGFIFCILLIIAIYRNIMKHIS